MVAAAGRKTDRLEFITTTNENSKEHTRGLIHDLRIGGILHHYAGGVHPHMDHIPAPGARKGTRAAPGVPCMDGRVYAACLLPCEPQG